MFEEKLVDTDYRIWPYTFELYTILSYKVLPRYSAIFNNLSKQAYSTIQALDLYEDPECKVVGEVKTGLPEFADVNGPLVEIFDLLSHDGAFEAEARYRPSQTLIFKILQLMTDSSTSLLWKVGHTDIKNEEKINAIFSNRQKEIRSEGTSTNRLNTIREKFKHDVVKLYFENRERWPNPNFASEQHDFQSRCMEIANHLGFEDYERFDRYLRDAIYEKQKLIKKEEYTLNERYFSTIN
jgi:hypothetical protein